MGSISDLTYPVLVQNQNSSFSIPAAIVLELHDHAGTLIGTVTGFYSIDDATNRCTIWWPALLGTAGQAGAMTITAASGADIPAAIQLSAWATDVDVVVINDGTKKAGTIGKSTNGVFTLTRTDANFSSGKVDGLPNYTQFTYPIAVDASDAEANELETVVLAQGYASITDFVQQMKTLQTNAITNQ